MIINKFCAGFFPIEVAHWGPALPRRKDCMNEWTLSSLDDEDREEIKQIVSALQEKISQWTKKLPTKQEVCETLGGLVQKAQQEDNYEKGMKGAKGSKGKGGTGRGKGKGKKNILNDLPSFDLKRAFPGKTVTSWQTAISHLERGEAPKGHICICKDSAQVLHFTELAAAGKVSSSFTMVAGYSDGDPIISAGTVTPLSFLGNLALKKAFVACLDGSKPEITFAQPSKVELKAGLQTQPMTSLRINIALNFVESKSKQVLLEFPSMALHYTGAKQFLNEAKTSNWTCGNYGILTGYVLVPTGKVPDIMKLGGRRNLFSEVG